MSCEYWAINGYGIKTSDLEVRDLASVWNLINMDEKLAKDTKEYLIDNIGSVEEAKLEDITYFTCEQKDDYRPGIAGILSIIIENIEGLQLVATDDWNDEEYLLMLPHFSWENISEKELNMTRDDFAALLNKYVSIVSDAPIDVDYYSADNCG